MLSSSEKINERMIERLLEIYTQAELDMLVTVKKRIARGITETGFAEEKLQEVQQLKEQFQSMLKNKNALAKSTVSKSIIDSYMAAKKSIKLGPRKGMPDVMTKDIVPYKIQRFIMEADRLIDGTQFQILRSVDDVYREVQSKTSAAILNGTQTTKQAAQQALNQYAARGITGFVDKIGRKWELQSYVEMAARTNAARAALQGHLDRMGELGRDLTIVSTKNATCPLCAPWSGQILSISGEDQRYPSLESAKAAGLFHPNCQHTLLDYDEDDEELNKELGIPQQGQTTGYDALKANNDEMYNATQTQRFNERQVRFWQKREAVALDEAGRLKAVEKIKEYKARNATLVSTYDLPREPGRERIITGNASRANSYKDYSALDLAKEKVVEVIKEVPIEAPKSLEWYNVRKKEFNNQNEEYIRMTKQYNDKAMNACNQYVKDASLRMRVPEDVLRSIVNDGRFKNQFETKTSSGLYDRNSRKEATRIMFNADINGMKPKDFEKYGYLFKGDAFADMMDGRVESYGDIIVEFKKKNVANRTTYTVGDSLWTAGGKGTMLPTKIGESGFAWDVSDSSIAKYMGELDGKDFTHMEFRRSAGASYVEAQYHGDLLLSDIDHVVLNPLLFKQDDLADLIEELQEKKIKVKIIDGSKIVDA